MLFEANTKHNLTSCTINKSAKIFVHLTGNVTFNIVENYQRRTLHARQIAQLFKSNPSRNNFIDVFLLS